VTVVSLHFCPPSSLSLHKHTLHPNHSSQLNNTKSCLEENLEEKLPPAKLPNLDPPRRVLPSLLAVSTVFSARATMLNELVPVLPVRGPFSLVDGWLLTCQIVYLAAVLEYLAAEILELAGNAARDNKKCNHIRLSHMLTRSPYHPPSSSACHPQRRRVEQVFSLFIFRH
jgi:hypothetical protein